jgi:hypothetical protein
MPDFQVRNYVETPEVTDSHYCYSNYFELQLLVSFLFKYYSFGSRPNSFGSICVLYDLDRLPLSLLSTQN